MKHTNLFEQLLPVIVDLFVNLAGKKDGLQVIKIEKERFVIAIHIKKKIKFFEFKDSNDIENLKHYLTKEKK